MKGRKKQLLSNFIYLFLSCIKEETKTQQLLG